MIPQDVVCISWICTSSWGAQIGCITRLQPEIYLRDRPRCSGKGPMRVSGQCVVYYDSDKKITSKTYLGN